MKCPKCEKEVKYITGDILKEHKDGNGEVCLGLKSEQKPRKQYEVKPDVEFHYESTGESVKHGRR